MIVQYRYVFTMSSPMVKQYSNSKLPWLNVSDWMVTHSFSQHIYSYSFPKYTRIWRIPASSKQLEKTPPAGCETNKESFSFFLMQIMFIMWAISIVNTLDKDYNVIFFTTKHINKQQTSMICADRANTHIYETLEYYTLKPQINSCTSQGLDLSF